MTLLNEQVYTTFILYADDCTCVFKSPSINDTFSEASHTLPTLTQYFRDNKLSLNMSKTKAMVLTKAYTIRIPLPILTIDMDSIELVDNFKLLGVTLDLHLSWQDRIFNICSKLRGLSAVLYKINHILSPSWRMKLYNAHFLPLINYNNTIWGNAASMHIHKISVIRKRTLRCIKNFLRQGHSLACCRC